MRAAMVAILISLVAASSALACSFHGFVVQPTLVDRLVTGTQVILARPDPDDRFRYVAVETLAGRPDRVEIAALVDAYAVVKCIGQIDPDAHFLVVVNRVPEPGRGKLAFEKLTEVEDAGSIVHDLERDLEGAREALTNLADRALDAAS